MPKCHLRKRRPPSETSAGTTGPPSRRSLLILLSKMKKPAAGWSVESPQILHRLISGFPRQQRRKQCDARMPSTSSSSNSGAECDDGLAADRGREKCFLRCCMPKDRGPFNKCRQILRQHVKGVRGKKNNLRLE